MSENGSWICLGCNAVMPEAAGPSWRWTGEIWQHRCPGMHPQTGHFDAKLLVTVEPGRMTKDDLPGDWIEQVVGALDNCRTKTEIPPVAVTLPWSWAAGLHEVRLAREIDLCSLDQYKSVRSVRLHGVDVMFGGTEKPVFSVMAEVFWVRPPRKNDGG